MRPTCKCKASKNPSNQHCTKCGCPTLPESVEELQQTLEQLISKLKEAEDSLPCNPSERPANLLMRDKRNLVTDIAFMLENVIKHTKSKILIDN
jgi:hypothetical protein